MAEIKVRRLLNLWEKTKGLIGKEKTFPVYFKTRWGIHTFGVKFPIDVLILDASDQIVVMKESLKPFRIFLWQPKWENVIELPAGEIKKLKLKIGNKVKLI